MCTHTHTYNNRTVSYKILLEMRLYVCICAYLKIHITKIKKKGGFQFESGSHRRGWRRILGMGLVGGSDNSILIKMCLLKRKKKQNICSFQVCSHQDKLQPGSQIQII